MQIRLGRSAGAQRVPARVVDSYLESYVRWREEAGAVRDAYAFWLAARRGERQREFAAYVAALEREEAAAYELNMYAERVCRAPADLRTRP